MSRLGGYEFHMIFDIHYLQNGILLMSDFADLQTRSCILAKESCSVPNSEIELMTLSTQPPMLTFL